MDRGEAGGRGAELHYMDGGRKQMSEAGRFLGSSSAYSLIRRLVQMRVRRVDGFPRRIGNWGRLKRLIYLLLDEGHQVGW